MIRGLLAWLRNEPTRGATRQDERGVAPLDAPLECRGAHVVQWPHGGPVTHAAPTAEQLAQWQYGEWPAQEAE